MASFAAAEDDIEDFETSSSAEHVCSSTAVAASSTRWFCRKRESLQQKASDERKQQEAQTAKECAKSVALYSLLLKLASPIYAREGRSEG